MRRSLGIAAMAAAAIGGLAITTLSSAPRRTFVRERSPARWKRRETKRAYRPWKVRAARKAQRRARRITRMHAK